LFELNNNIIGQLIPGLKNWWRR